MNHQGGVGLLVGISGVTNLNQASKGSLFLANKSTRILPKVFTLSLPGRAGA